MPKLTRQLVLLFIMAVFTNIGFAQTIKKSGLYGVWVSGFTNTDMSMIDMIILKPNGTGSNSVVMISEDYQMKTTRSFSWKFNESTNEFFQLIKKVTASMGNGAESVEPMEEITSTLRMISLDGNASAIIFNDRGDDSGIFLKVDSDSLRDLTK